MKTTIQVSNPPAASQEATLPIDCVSVEQPQVQDPTVFNDLTQQIKNQETFYQPKEWVHTKLYQIKTASTLSTETTVLPETVTVRDNILSFAIVNGNNNTTMEVHFFENGIFKFNCVNPANPSKFSFELVEKPANLAAYPLQGKVVTDNNGIEVTMSEAQAKVIVKFNPFTVSLLSAVNGTHDTLFEMNTNRSLQFDQNLTADFAFHTEYIYGLPERACNLLLEDTKADLPYRFYNTDLPTYPLGSKNGLYGTVPIIVSRKKNSSARVSMYWQNTSDTYIDIHKTGATTQAYWLSERGNLECYIFVSHSNAAHFKAFSDVFGHCAMPQFFSLGYHQCRWSYKDQKDVLQVNGKFNEHEIPCDTITLDIDHTDGCRYFTWNEKLFPDPLAMQQELVDNGRQLVTIADPHIRADEKYHVYQEAMEKGLFVFDNKNKPFVGHCWPGASLYLDFLNEETRQCWASQYGYDKYKKSTPNVWAWNDMNEPSVFEMPGNHMPPDNLQTFKTLAEPEKAFQVEHREVHNIYGYCHHKATYDGMVKRNECKNIRPHVLSRSFFAGSQKWTTIWTGDTGATWGYLKVTIPQMLSLSLCGLSNVGGDVGGFMGNPEPELAVRWYQLGTFMPYFRAHSETTTKRREPWLYEKRYLDIIKESIKERYRLLPYWYTSFEEHCRTAVPLLRPIWFDQENALEDSNMEEQERFMVGDGILVVPILEEGQVSVSGVLKGLEGRWYDYFTKKEVVDDGEIKTGLERIGCFVKGGKIIPTYEIKSYVKSSKDAKQSNIHLYVALDEEDNAKGSMYFDDGETFDYKKGKFARKNIEFNKDTFSWQGEEAEGFTADNRVTKVTIMGCTKKFERAFLVGEDQKKKKIQLVQGTDSILLEFVTLASKNWKIVLE